MNRQSVTRGTTGSEARRRIADADHCAFQWRLRRDGYDIGQGDFGLRGGLADSVFASPLGRGGNRYKLRPDCTDKWV